MKIVLDLRTIRRPESGDGQFSINLVKGLAGIDTRNKYTLLVRPGTEAFFKVGNANFKLRTLSIKPHSVTDQILLPGIVRKEKADLFHSFTYAMPYWIGCRSIINIYDIIHMHFSRNYPYLLKLYYEIIVKRCAKKADSILTLSNHSKKDIAKILSVNYNKIRIIYCGRSDRFFPMDKARVKTRLGRDYGLKQRFLLYVGNLRPHKNVEALLYAFKRCLDKIPNLELVICAKKKFSFERIEQEVSSLGLNNRVKFMDYIDDEALPLLYNGASVLVFPSLYEGFGLPPLEAISCGTPVVSSNAASLPEILGDAVKFVDPKDVNGFSEAITEVLSDEDLAESLRRKGLERSKFFSWEKSARELLDLYIDLVGHRR